jgi:POT family proton-dependent oligopeptide transporter
MNAATEAATLPPGRRFLGHPLGLATLFFTEMWERMSFYGMRALLVLFLVGGASRGGLGLDDRTAAAIYGLYNAGTYIACLPGGWIGDRLLGAQRAVLIGGIVIACGHLLLGVAPSSAVFFAGLLVIVLGTGLLKPNASAAVAQLYPEGGARRDAGFTLYYVGINVGATIGPLITALLAQRYGWPAGFMAAAVGMTLGVAQFLWWRGLLGDAGRSPMADDRDGGGSSSRPALSWLIGAGAVVVAVVALVWRGAIVVSPSALQSISTAAVIAIAVFYFSYLLFWAGLDTVERRRVRVVAVLFLASVLFWAGYEQTGSSFNLFAERYTARTFSGFVIPAGWFQSLNPILIIVFAPVFSALWVQLGRRNLDPSAPLKFVFGLLGMALGFIVMAAAARLVASGQQVSPGWLTLTYMLHTFGELCLSPVGLSAVTGLVPRRFVGQSLGVWFVSISLGNLFAGRIAGEVNADQVAAMPGQYLNIFWYGAACAALLLLALPLVQRWMGGVQ